MSIIGSAFRIATAPARAYIGVVKSTAGVIGEVVDALRDGQGPSEKEPVPGVDVPAGPPRPAPEWAREREQEPEEQEVPLPAEAAVDEEPVVPLPPEAKTLDDAPVLVAEFGEDGAEEAAGAEIHVDEPWDGYDKLKAPEIGRVLADADSGVAAAVTLYESTRRNRKSVLSAAERRLKLLEA